MKEVIEKIKSNERLPDILTALAEVHPDDYENAHNLVNDTDVTQVGILISSRLNVGGVDATLATGGLLLVYQLVTDCDTRRGLPGQLLDDLGISKSQAYRCVDVWERFGERLINNPGLKSFFVVESLKILSAVGVSPLAREASVEMARRKQKVRIGVAEDLVAQFASPEEARTTKTKKLAKPKGQAKPQSQRGKKVASIWEYAGKAIRFVVRPAKSKQTVDHAAIIEDLETALAQYRKEYAREQTAPTNAKFKQDEVSHA